MALADPKWCRLTASGYCPSLFDPFRGIPTRILRAGLLGRLATPKLEPDPSSRSRSRCRCSTLPREPEGWARRARAAPGDVPAAIPEVLA
jgi:hypothetical protein